MISGGFTQRQQLVVYEAEQLLHKINEQPQLALMMHERGYDDASWAHGAALLDAVKEAARVYAQAQSARLRATNRFRQQRDLIWAHSSTLAQSCVTLFQGQTDYLNALGLHGRRKDENGTSTISRPHKHSKVEQVVSWQRNLFEVAQSHPQIASNLATHGFPPERLVEGAAGVEALARAEFVQEQAKATVTQRRIERDAAFKDLRTWLRCVQRVARLVG